MIYREQCSLILDQNTLIAETKNGETEFKGTFIPINPKTVKWLEHLNRFINKSIDNSLLVEVGPLSIRQEERLKRTYSINEQFVGLVLKNIVIDTESNSYTITFKPIGIYKDFIENLIVSIQPFILSTKTLNDQQHRAGDDYFFVNEVVGFVLLRAEDLNIPIPKDILEKCKLPSGNIMNNNESNPLNHVIIKMSNFISDDISKGNKDLESVVKLNLAAGNFINYQNAPADTDVQNQIKRQLNVDINECFELLEAYVTGDVSLLRDALADKRITLNGFQTILPFSLIGDYRSAVENNFTRFDHSRERALETQHKYKELGVPTEIIHVVLNAEQNEEFFVNKVIDDVTANTGEVFTKGKWVKSKYFENDNFKDIDGLFKDNNPVNISERYLHVRAVLEKLTNHLDEVYQKSIKS